MTGTPFTSRRSRPCHLGEFCPHGGRIRPGDRALRHKRTRYVHDGDIEHAVALFEHTVAALRYGFENLAPIFAEAAQAFAVPPRLHPDHPELDDDLPIYGVEPLADVYTADRTRP